MLVESALVDALPGDCPVGNATTDEPVRIEDVVTAVLRAVGGCAIE